MAAGGAAGAGGDAVPASPASVLSHASMAAAATCLLHRWMGVPRGPPSWKSQPARYVTNTCES